MSNPFLSFIIPTKDRPQFVNHVLLHLAEASFGFDYEVVIVDGSDSEKTYNTINKHPQKKNVTYVKEVNNLPLKVGAPSYLAAVLAILTGTMHAKGHYVAYLGDDDFVVPDILNKICEDLRINKYDAAFPGLSAWDDKQKKILGKIVTPPPNLPIFSQENCLDLLYLNMDLGLSPEYCIYKRETFLSIAHYMPDCYLMFFWLTLIAKQGQVKLYPDAAFLLTKNSDLYNDDYTSLTPGFLESIPLGAETAYKVLGALLSPSKFMPLWLNPTNAMSLTNKYLRRAQVDGISAYANQKKFLKAYIHVLQNFYYGGTLDLFSPQKSFIKGIYPAIYLKAISQLIIFRAIFIGTVRQAVLYGFQSPEKLIKEVFSEIKQDIDVVSIQKLKDLKGSLSNKLIVTKSLAQKKEVLEKHQLNASQCICYEELTDFFGLRFTEIDLDI